MLRKSTDFYISHWHNIQWQSRFSSHRVGSLIELQILAGKVEHLWKHLCHCPYVPSAIKDLANTNIAAKHQHSATWAVTQIEVIPGGNSSSVLQGAEMTLVPPPPLRASSRCSSVSSVPSVMVNIPFSGETAPRPIPSAMLSKFHADLCWLVVSGIISWCVIEHPFWRHFFAKWIPGLVLPGCDVLSGHILDEEVAKADAWTKEEVQNHYATGHSDGWKNIAKKSLIANMMNVEYRVR